MKNRNRLTKKDESALHMLDVLLENERKVEQRYELPFRAPREILTSLQQCEHCGEDIALLIFGDSASDVPGLEAYARLMKVPVVQTNLPTWVITPPLDPSSLENPSLLLKIHPDKGAPCLITPDEWLNMIHQMSDNHCKLCRKSGKRSKN
ncbi:hypothetical protein [Yersinia bercovieri]|uniref:Uncharacterized protein n=1 Tax=Yersinia bercovieri ATCC 43970 TaxID=349968 RepID=A0ABM9XWU2_YERBE|nr:hypothetical protein [Yersinia bercovieri]EEQ05825.1 hypothetical protein yberc0001_36100 [Yersinia bercovieri ATCC 43970]QKJ09175.1 hypothetical protein HRK25_19725 [Yersinia bercovieri ATCC 43970]